MILNDNKFALRDYTITIDSERLPVLHTGGAWLYDGCETEEDAERAAFRELCQRAESIGRHATCDRATRDLEHEKWVREDWHRRHSRPCALVFERPMGYVERMIDELH